jgi:hypothetical protein
VIIISGLLRLTNDRLLQAMRTHNAIFVTGFVVTNLLALTKTPFWPIWWSQLGLQEGDGAPRAVFVATCLATAGAYLWQMGASSNTTLLGDVLAIVGMACFAGMALYNSNRQPIRGAHNTLAALSGLFTVGHIVVALYYRPRNRVPSWLVTGAIFVALFLVETVIKRLIWVPPSHASHALEFSAIQIALLRLSSLAQWLQLALFMWITECTG